MRKFRTSLTALLLAAMLTLSACVSVEVSSAPAPTSPEPTANLPVFTETEAQEEDPSSEDAEAPADEQKPAAPEVVYEHFYFRNNKLLTQHYEKHGIEMGFDSKEEYEEAACAVINNPDALSKTEKEDGDYVFYIVDTNEFVILSTDGYIRTYFLPSSGLKYYNKQ